MSAFDGMLGKLVQSDEHYWNEDELTPCTPEEQRQMVLKDRIVMEARSRVGEWHGVELEGAETCGPLCSAVAKWVKCQERL